MNKNEKTRRKFLKMAGAACGAAWVCGCEERPARQAVDPDKLPPLVINALQDLKKPNREIKIACSWGHLSHS